MVKQRSLYSDRGAVVGHTEVRRHPEPRDRLVMVGGDPGTRRVWPGGVPPATDGGHAYRDRSVMPTARARRPYPQAVCPDRDLAPFCEPSPGRRAILRDLGPAVAATSLDEPYLDPTDLPPFAGLSGDIVTTINGRPGADPGLTAPAEVAHYQTLAPVPPTKTPRGS